MKYAVTTVLLAATALLACERTNTKHRADEPPAAPEGAPGQGSWKPMSAVGAPSPRVWPELSFNGINTLLVWGGHTDATNGTPLADGGIYDVQADAWKALPASVDVASPGRLGVKEWVDGSFVAYGAYDDPALRGGILHHPYEAWTALAAEGAPLGVNYGGGTWHDAQARRSKLVVWARGSRCGDAAAPDSALTVAILDPEANKWTALAAAGAPADAGCHEVALVGDRLVLWGTTRLVDSGTAPAAALEGGALDLLTGQWEKIPADGAPFWRSSPLLRRLDDHRLLVWSGQLYATNGDEFQIPLGDGAVYDFKAKTWQALTTEGAPPPRHGRVHVLGGDAAPRLLVWGGFRNKRGNVETGETRDGAVYDFATARWAALPTEGAPAARVNETQEPTPWGLVVWGGVTFEPEPIESGAVLDLEKLAWTPISQRGAPRARFGYGTAWWQRSWMFAWGGALDGGGGPVSDGFIYMAEPTAAP